MRIDLALKHRDGLKRRIADIYSIAIISGMTSNEINAAVISATNDLPRNVPHWVKTYCDGFRAALQDSLYADCLVFGGYVNGVFYSTHRNRPDYYGKHGIDPAAYADNGLVQKRGHYWRETIAWRGGIYTRGTVKPYYGPES